MHTLALFGLAISSLLLGTVMANADVPKEAKPVRVEMETSMGKIKLELYPDKAPKTVENFLAYVADKSFDGTIFHRVAKDFVIQGGGYEPGMKLRKTRDPIPNEAKNGLSNDKGTISMARTNDPDSATNQFFINLVDNSGKLDPGKLTREGYAVFGKVIEGMDVVEKIGKVEIDKPKDGRPKEDVIIKTVRQVEK